MARFKLLAFCGILVLLLPSSQAKSATCDKQCNIYEVPNKNCTGCVCKENYINLNGLGCDACKQCEKPMITLEKCSDKRQINTKCGSCPEGTFYHENGCRNCTKCDGITKTPCGIDKDSECWPVLTNKTNTTGTQCQDELKILYEKVKLGNPVFRYLFVFTLTALVISLFVNCLLWKRQKTPKRRRMRADTSSLTAISKISLVPKMPTLKDLTAEEGRKLIRDFPGDLYESLAKYLNPLTTNNWKTLAGILGYTLNEIANIEVSGGNNHAEFTQQLLCIWGSKNCATVNALAKALLRIEREDAFNSLFQYVTKSRQNFDETSISTVEEISAISEDMLDTKCQSSIPPLSHV